MKITMEDIVQWELLLQERESAFTANRTRIRELKQLILISENPQAYESFKKDTGKQINTLNCKTELSKLVMKNERINADISALKSNIEKGREMLGGVEDSDFEE